MDRKQRLIESQHEIINRLKQGQSYFRISKELNFNSKTLKRFIDNTPSIHKALSNEGIVITRGLKSKSSSTSFDVPEQCELISQMIKNLRTQINKPFFSLFRKIERFQSGVIADYIKQHRLPTVLYEFKITPCLYRSINRINSIGVFKFLLLNFDYNEELFQLLNEKRPIKEIIKILNLHYNTIRNYTSITNYPRYKSIFIKYN